MALLQLCRNLTGELTRYRIWQTKEEHCDWFKSWTSNWWNVHSFPVLQASGIKSSNFTIYSIFILGGGLPLLLWCVAFVKTAWLALSWRPFLKSHFHPTLTLGLCWALKKIWVYTWPHDGALEAELSLSLSFAYVSISYEDS